MKQYLGLGLAMLAGSVLGAAAVTGLNAQVKAPSVYLVTEIDVTNPEAYGKEFAPKAQATIKAAGGRLVAIGGAGGAGGAGAKPVAAIEGTPPKRIVIQGWDSIDQVKSWYKSADYRAALKIGSQYATFRRYAVQANE